VGPPPQTRGRQRPARRAEIRVRTARRRAAVASALFCPLLSGCRTWSGVQNRELTSFVRRVWRSRQRPDQAPHAPPPLRTRNRFASAPLPPDRLRLNARLARRLAWQMPSKGAIQSNFISILISRVSPQIRCSNKWTMVSKKCSQTHKKRGPTYCFHMNITILCWFILSKETCLLLFLDTNTKRLLGIL
jgi:hypothetical protein